MMSAYLVKRYHHGSPPHHSKNLRLEIKCKNFDLTSKNFVLIFFWQCVFFVNLVRNMKKTKLMENATNASPAHIGF